MLKARIIERFSIVKKQNNRYHSFPTLAKVNDLILLTCRSGYSDSDEPHGRGGQVRLLSAAVTSPEQWQDHGVLFGESGGKGYELDALISGPFSSRASGTELPQSVNDKQLILITREYRVKQFNRNYMSYLDIDSLKALTGTGLNDASPSISTPLQRSLLKEEGGIDPSACFGHIKTAADGALLLCGYGVAPGESVVSPLLWHSYDRGRSWQLRAIVARSTDYDKKLNEFSLAFCGNKKWLAVIRDNMEPHIICQAYSEDDGVSWSPPQETEICGHAPQLYYLNDKQHLMLLRDLTVNQPSVSIYGSDNQGGTWQTIAELNVYAGGIYNGGYGDLIHLQNDRYLAVYYVSDTEGSPWIEGVIFTLSIGDNRNVTLM